MALKVTNDDPAIAYAGVKTRLRTFRQYTSDVRAACAAGSVSGNLLKEYFLRLISERAANVTAAAVTGLGAFAQEYDGGAGYDVSAEFSALNTALDAARDWMIANVPVATQGEVRMETWLTSGVSVRVFTTGQTAGFRTTLDSVLAAMS
jgi:hypothetical protein